MGYIVCTGPDCPICRHHDAMKAPDDPAWTVEVEPAAEATDEEAKQ